MKTIFNKLCLFGVLICFSMCLSLKDLNKRIKQAAYDSDELNVRRLSNEKNKLERMLSSKYHKIVKDNRKLNSVMKQSPLSMETEKKNKIGKTINTPSIKQKKKQPLKVRKTMGIDLNSIENKLKKGNKSILEKTRLNSKLLIDDDSSRHSKNNKAKTLEDKIPLLKKGEEVVDKFIDTIKNINKPVATKDKEDTEVDSMSNSSDSGEDDIDSDKTAKDIVSETINQDTQPTIQSDIDKEANQLVAQTQEQEDLNKDKADLDDKLPEGVIRIEDGRDRTKTATLRDDNDPEIDSLHSDLNSKIPSDIEDKKEKEDKSVVQEDDSSIKHEIDTSVVHKEDSKVVETHEVPLHHEDDIDEQPVVIDETEKDKEEVTDSKPVITDESEKDKEKVTDSKPVITDEPEKDKEEVIDSKPVVIDEPEKDKEEVIDSKPVVTDEPDKKKEQETIMEKITKSAPLAKETHKDAVDQLKETREQVKVIQARTIDKPTVTAKETTLILYSALSLLLTLFALI